ncbi:hypothetical protein JCM17961_04920 [Endothiovibrio diazotrophicus]
MVHRRLEFDLAKLIFLGGGGTFAFALALDLDPVHGIYIASITGFVGIMLLLSAPSPRTPSIRFNRSG